MRKVLLSLALLLVCVAPCSAHGPLFRSRVAVVFDSSPVIVQSPSVVVTRSPVFATPIQSFYSAPVQTFAPVQAYSSVRSFGTVYNVPMPAQTFVDVYGNVITLDQFGRVLSIR